ncbi:MAG: hypothetical protein AAF211_05960 [Myxococcota bacterium]
MRSWLSSLFVAMTLGCAAAPEEAACTELTWETYGRGYVTSWCTGCHHSALDGALRAGAPEGVDFDQHDGVIAWLDRIESRATGTDPTMPPVGGSDAAERARFAGWLACGAP